MYLLTIIISLGMLTAYPLQGIPKYKFKEAKIKHNIRDLCQIHHIIPSQYRNHPVLRGLNLDDGVNLMLLPNRVANEYMLLNTARPVHDGGHAVYNKFVEDILDDMITYPYASQDDVLRLIVYLRYKIRHSTVPWR